MQRGGVAAAKRLCSTHKARVGRSTALGLRQIDVQPAAFKAFGSFASLMSFHVQPVSLAAVPASQLRTLWNVVVNLGRHGLC